ncbi:MAG: hypothetical protein AMXMBFR34_07990 [Myxococcaceae bacterium]
MPTLEKATLYRLRRTSSSGAPPPTGNVSTTPDTNDVEGAPIPVQFNPQTLKLTLSNQVTDGGTRGNQARQFSGKSSTELAFDLHFDTADEGETNSPRSVREKTRQVEQFVLPEPDPANGERRLVPPRVRFVWGDLRIEGVISSLAIDFDLFAANGVPLRAKMSVSIKEQDARYESLQVEEGAGSGGAGGAGGQPGSAGTASTNRTGAALAGESAADFAQRMGLDPRAWRGLAAGLDGTLSLSAGVEIDFDASLSLGAGLGASFGVTATLGASLEASFGLEATVSAGASVAGGAAASGFALAAAGGVSAALDTVATLKNERATGQARAAFGAPAPSARETGTLGAGTLPSAVLAAAARGEAVHPASPQQARPPLRAESAGGTTQIAASPAAAPPVPRADPRAVGWGGAVPLKPMLGGTGQGVVVLGRATEAAQARCPPTRRRTADCGCGCGGHE